MRRCALALAILLITAPAWAQDVPRLGLPIDCRLGETCWLMNYADTDPGPDAKDFRCGPRSYQGHDGTDFAIRDKAVMNRGIPVVAALAGEVVGARDGQPDGTYLTGGRSAVQDKECGNGVMLKHEGGWTTQYCHMRRGSVAVRQGQKVAQGDRLGLVGLSGMSEYPHVHLTVRKDSKPIDPFTGTDLASGCGKAEKAMWDVPYVGTSLYATGFADRVPDKKQLMEDSSSPASLSVERPLVLWTTVFGAVAGDRISFTIRGPDGQAVFSHAVPVERTQAWRLVAAGRKPPAGGWPAGRYMGETVLERDGRPLGKRSVEIELRP